MNDFSGGNTRPTPPGSISPDATTPDAGSPFGAGPTNAGSDGLIRDGSVETFEQDVLAASMQVPVIVDFWAPWCGPCKQLTPALEKAVTAAGGRVRLVKIDIDKNQMLASQLRVQSVPTVYAFFQGQPVDGFMGAVPDSELAAFIERITAAAGNAPAPNDAGPDIEQLTAAATEAFNQGDVATAAQVFAQLAQLDPTNTTALAGLSRCYIAMGEIDQARTILESAPEDKKNDPAIRAVEAAIELASADAQSGDLNALQAALEQNSDDLQARYDLATALIANGDMADAIDHLLVILEKDRAWDDEAGRKKLLTVFEALGPTDPLVKSGRRRMSAIFFS